MTLTSESTTGKAAAPSTKNRRRQHLRTVMLLKVAATAVLTLVVISLLTFAATNLKSPDDVARAALGRQTPQPALTAYAERHGLNDPFAARYAHWLGGFVTGDMGTSATTNRPVSDDVLPRMKNTLVLALAALVIALPVSIGLGVFMARRSGSKRDVSLLLSTVILASLPEFIVAIALVLIFGVQLHMLPVDASALQFGTAGAKAKAGILPVATLVLALLPHISRIARAATTEALAAPYVASAVLRGLSPRRVTWDYAMRNAAIPLVNAVALNVIYLLGGVIVVEQVFAFPGIGQLFVEAIGAGDSLTVLAITMLLGMMFITVSLVADLLVLYFNPRLKSAS